MANKEHFGKLCSLFLIFAATALAACGQKLDLEVNARIDGTPAAGAKVTVDGEQLGATDAQGMFKKQLTKKAGAESAVTVIHEQPGYRVEPWKGSFLVKLPKDGAIDTYRLDADLNATRYVTLRVTENGAPLPEAKIVLGRGDVGATDVKGEFQLQYKEPPKSGEVSVSKDGYTTARVTQAFEPGQVVDVALSRKAVVSITALTDEYGRTGGVAGLGVSVNGKPVGKTDAQGRYNYVYSGDPGKQATITVAAPGYVPPEWKNTVKLEGAVELKRYFHPTTPRPIRLGVFRVIGNTPGVDLKEVAAQTEQAMVTQLFKFPGFREVPSQQLQATVQNRKLNVDRIATKGWQDTPLRATVDMMVFGSVAKDDDGYLVEAKVHTASGKIIISEIARARSESRIAGTVRDIVNNIIERFPLEGTVIGTDGDRYRVNIGRNWRISRGTEFTLTKPALGEGGKVAGYLEAGRLEVTRSDDASSLVAVETVKQGVKVALGDRVVRRIEREGEAAGERTYFLLTAKGGVGNSVVPLAGANVYLDGSWAGATSTTGQVEVPLRLNRNYTLTLYRHGYQQHNEKIKIAKSGEAREFALVANNALFKVESLPQPATVFIDDEQVGKTPITDGRPVTLGFHSVRLTHGEEYRDFYEVMEFARKEEDRTGERRIVLHKDLLKIGERAQQKGDVDAAITAYAGTERSHPDYAEAHRRLGRLYLDEKQDFDRAIAEFEAVLAMPEHQQLIYKQFAVTFTNLGNAYYEKGNRLIDTNRDAAAEHFAKAIKALQTARQNTRFFPNAEYDEAVHDTYYFTALSYHKLYLVTKQPAIMNSASLAWREYFDFFPKKLEGQPEFEQAREAARRYRDQVGDL